MTVKMSKTQCPKEVEKKMMMMKDHGKTDATSAVRQAVLSVVTDAHTWLISDVPT